MLSQSFHVETPGSAGWVTVTTTAVNKLLSRQADCLNKRCVNEIAEQLTKAAKAVPMHQTMHVPANCDQLQYTAGAATASCQHVQMFDHEIPSLSLERVSEVVAESHPVSKVVF